MKLQPDEDDLEYAWHQRETLAAQLEFIEALPDDALNMLAVSSIWPPELNRSAITEAAIAHPGLSIISAIDIYSRSGAYNLGDLELRGEQPDRLMATEEDIALVQTLRDKINAMEFADKVYPYQHFSCMLKSFVRDNSAEKFGSYAVGPHVISYVVDAMEADKQASDKMRYDFGEGPVKSDEALQSVLTALEDPDERDILTRTGRAAIWVRKKFGLS